MKMINIPLNFFKTGVLCLVTIGLGACQSVWEAEPTFGSSVNSAVQSQLVNPEAPIGNQKVTKGLDGTSAKSAVDNYQKSFETRIPTSSGTYPTGVAIGTGGGSR